ncbi:alkaline phosphatase, partial [Porticoccaceae bacterium]|nr:alkaline phosphatase [Porticoccaceae bacterium]
MNKFLITPLAVSLFALQGCDTNNSISDAATENSSPLTHMDNSWYVESAAKVEDIHTAMTQLSKNRGAAKNIILFIGDGMSIGTVTAARILDGQQKGMSGEENSLSFGHFPFTGLSKTYNVDAQTPDSAGTMTAIISGVKTDVGVIGLNENVVMGDCSSGQGNELMTALE